MVWGILHDPAVDLRALENYNPGQPTILYDDAGVEWARFEMVKREPVSIQQIPEHVIHAFLAAEDKDFFSHGGISWRGIVRSLWVNIRSRKFVQGASTITQQLVKLLFCDSGKTWQRKIKEQILALVVEQRMSKEYILQTYLNHVYFGVGVYGVEGASNNFWGCTVRDLTVAQGAMLAGIVKWPARYCPRINTDQALVRRNYVLKNMLRAGFITPEVYTQACAEKCTLSSPRVVQAPYFRQALGFWLEEKFGKETLYTGGLRVYTTLNSTMQAQAEGAFCAQIAKLRATTLALSSINGGLVTIESETGAIKALIGGYNFAESQFNRVTQARRQLGSLFKPLLYACAVREGATMADVAVDEPITINGWSPQNYHKTFEGPMILARALSHSINSIAVKILISVGYDAVCDLAHKAGIKTSLTQVPALALGCVDVTPLEVVEMFTLFSNNGRCVNPYGIVRIVDTHNHLWYEHAQTSRKLLSSRIAGQITQVLKLTAERLIPDIKKLKCEAIGKSGTTNQSRTCWFCGATPGYTTAIYMGTDDNKSLGSWIYPVHTVIPVWTAAHRAYGHTQMYFMHDPTLYMVPVHQRTGKILRDLHDPEALPILL